MIAGAIGGGYFVYGKKESRYVMMVCGAALCLYPYFVEGLWLSILVGVVLLALPFVFKS